MTEFDDVAFDFAGATELAATLRSTARIVDHHAGEREQLGAQVQQEWRGVYQDRFDTWLVNCVRHTHSIAGELLRLANQLDQAAENAQREQKRREQVRVFP